MTPILQHRTELTFDVGGPDMLELTAMIAKWLARINARDGLLTVFLRHTSASLVIQENGDPNVRTDLIDALKRLAPESSAYRHNAEGADDMPAHIKAMLTSVSLSIPVFEHTMALGQWQGVFLIEHRKRHIPRTVLLHYIGACD
jgi:secondary thiamine-phosphate synthase enzyme